MTPSLPARVRVVVIGAGQAGLSVAYHLRRLGLRPVDEVLVLDRGPRAGGAWQFRWESLRLGTAHRVNDLPGMGDLGLSFATADQSRPARDVVREYYERYEEAYGLGVMRPVTVLAVEAADAASGLLVVRTDAGDVLTEVVVNASGTWGSPFRPYVRGEETFRGRQFTTPEYVRAEDFRGRRVVVVGGGTSAVGFVLELEGVAASTTWVTRREPEFMAGDALNQEAGIAAVTMQDEAAKQGLPLPSIVSGTRLVATPAIAAARERGVLQAHPMFTSIEPAGVRFADGSFEPADDIIWATGFRPELSHLAPLGLRERSGGLAVERGHSLRDARVFLAGYGPQASTIGANRAGRLVARQVVAQLAETTKGPSPEDEGPSLASAP
ncbi:FAD-dependent oxidoreductase [Herbiconiux daphne]|uniref:FAD-dependent oxidoreductase n=1 Tax=Herbiconiux daphne TaxID=2970914 RepID=A0ABT2GXE6_9MICO|nr:FAD-dependent oxidoreductase [Herbiconiux daphne]MCS5732556.1 FAD-dependent oxidoreductase [Herbiconiux daphne]